MLLDMFNKPHKRREVMARSIFVLGKTYRVTWKDHFSDSSWKDEKEIREWVEECKSEPCVTIGDVVYQDEDVLVLSATTDGGDNRGDLMGIYKNHIIKKQLIKL